MKIINNLRPLFEHDILISLKQQREQQQQKKQQKNSDRHYVLTFAGNILIIL